MKTTFVLGAGASRDAGYTFAADMGTGLFKWMSNAEPESICDFSASASFLQSAFETPEDIEALLKQLDELTALHDSPILENRIIAAQANEHRQVLIHALRRWFEQIAQTPSESYRLFARNVLKPGDTVMTFNYDVSLDMELKRSGLWNVGDGYGFEVENLPAHSQITLLKLHGSINWRALLFGGRSAGAVNTHEGSLGTRPVFFDDDLRLLGTRTRWTVVSRDIVMWLRSIL